MNNKKQPTLKQCIELMKVINNNPEYESFFENGTMIIQSKIIIIKKE